MDEKYLIKEMERENEIFYKLLYYIECDLKNSNDDSDLIKLNL